MPEDPERTRLLGSSDQNPNSPLEAEPDDGRESSREQGQRATPSSRTDIGIPKRLYVSHFLSTANSRLFEFGSVLYLASIFPGTLLPLSVYAVGRGLSAIVLSSALGHYIDVGNRLTVVRLSIVLQRVAVAASCAILFVLERGWLDPGSPLVVAVSLAVVTGLACVEKLASIVNLVSVERDWVVTICQDDQGALRTMNSQMRRIDLVCKLFGPFLIAIIDSMSTETAILVNFGINVASMGVEYITIAQIYHSLPQLQQPRSRALPGHSPAEAQRGVSALDRCRGAARKVARDTKLYFSHRAFAPSFAGALLYLTVLSFSGQMVTYLLASGYSSAHVAVARTVSVAFEVTATWAAPWLMGKIGAVRAGLWFCSWQTGTLLLGMAAFWALKGSRPVASASGIVIGTIASRLGLWGFDLCTQMLIQEEVEEEHRGTFSTSEQAWQNGFELCSYVSTIILSSPDQFGYPASVSVLAVVSALVLYSGFVNQRRGHLLHWPSSCIPEKRYTDRVSLMATPSQRRSWFNS